MKQERIELPRAADHVWRAAAATLRSHVEGHSIDDVIGRDYPEDRVTDLIVRGTSTQAVINDGGSGWAGPLARYAVSQAVEDIVAMSAIDRLLEVGALHVDMGRLAQLTIPGRATTAGMAGQWLAEGAPAQVKQYSILGPTLKVHKLEVITTVTWELSNASNIEAILRALMAEAAGLAIDAAVFGNAAASAAQSAGLLNGLTALTPSTATGLDGCAADLGALVADIASRGGGRRAAFIAAPAQSVAIRFFAGGQFGVTPENDTLPVAASAALPNGSVICLEPESFACSFGAPQFSVSNTAALHMEDTTPLQINPGTPSTPVKSMFQIDALALKMTLWGDWCMRAPHVSFMSGVSW